MFKVVLTFNSHNGLDIKELLKVLPIKKYSNGSVVWFKNSLPWLDYINVPIDKLFELLEFIQIHQIKDIDVKFELQ